MLDPRLHAIRDDLADIRLKDRVAAPRYAEGRVRRVIAGRTPMRRSPHPTAPVDTFCHYGETVSVFDEAEGDAWCQSRADDYVGYVARRDLAAVEAGAEPTHYVVPPSAWVYAEPDLRSPAIDVLPRHAAAIVAEAGLVTRNTEYARLDPAGFLPLSCLSPAPPRSPDLVVAASLYLGAPYLWGGRSALGIDCSGLVQQAFRDLGTVVPRDADMQQNTIGDAVPIESERDLEPGDLIYLPGHVMICADGGEIIHANGAAMIVSRDGLARIMRDWGLDFRAFTVRRSG
jgi:cell wall-associated NlpC family hydrolase